MIVVFQTLAWTAWAGAALLFVLSKAFFLAPYRIGWPMLLANAAIETVERRLRYRRETQDWVLWLATSAGAALLGGPWFGLCWALASGMAAGAALLVERRWCADSPARQMESLKGRVPLPVPRLIVSLRGPVLQRGSSVYALGHWPQGWSQRFEVIVLNPGLVRPQLPMTIAVTAQSDSIEVTSEAATSSCPEPGQAVRHAFVLRARTVGPGGEVRIEVSHGDLLWRRVLRIDSILSLERSATVTAAIRRWKYGCRAAFSWRGDNDLYDPSTFQSPQGLRMALGLAARYRMPTTIMLSPRLSLEQEEHRAFCERFGWDRHPEEVPAFVQFFRDEVDMTNEQEYPTAIEKPLSAEIGNHMYLHYGTHAAADPGNGWKSHSKMGAGNYPWLRKHPCTSFEEQRDNLVKCSESTERHLGVKTTCFAIPSDVYDADTSRAVEAAGLEVGNDTDTSKLQRLLFFPKEHHPDGCERLAELTRLLPRDPLNAPQVAMLKFWMAFARRNGRALVYLAHHHLVMYETNACYNLTSELLRHVLADTEGDVHAATVTALGRYWRDVLSERTRCIRIEIQGNEITVHNSADHPLAGLPLEIDLGGGRSTMALVDVPARGSTRVSMGAAA